jgi:hypothetical protein
MLGPRVCKHALPVAAAAAGVPQCCMSVLAMGLRVAWQQQLCEQLCGSAAVVPHGLIALGTGSDVEGCSRLWSV